MTEVLAKPDWLKLWDHVLSNSSPFLMFLVLSYLVYFRAQILSAETLQQMEGITRRCNPVDLNQVRHICYNYGENQNLCVKLYGLGRSVSNQICDMQPLYDIVQEIGYVSKHNCDGCMR